MRFIIIQPIKHFSSSEKLEIGDVALLQKIVSLFEIKRLRIIVK